MGWSVTRKSICTIYRHPTSHKMFAFCHGNGYIDLPLWMRSSTNLNQVKVSEYGWCVLPLLALQANSLSVYHQMERSQNATVAIIQSGWRYGFAPRNGSTMSMTSTFFPSEGHQWWRNTYSTQDTLTIQVFWTSPCSMASMHILGQTCPYGWHVSKTFYVLRCGSMTAASEISCRVGLDTHE